MKWSFIVFKILHAPELFSYYSNSVFSFTLSILLPVVTNLKPMTRERFQIRRDFFWKINNNVTERFFFWSSSFEFCYIIDNTIVIFFLISVLFSALLIISITSPSDLAISQTEDLSLVAWDKLIVLKTPLHLLIDDRLHLFEVQLSDVL